MPHMKRGDTLAIYCSHMHIHWTKNCKTTLEYVYVITYKQLTTC